VEIESAFSLIAARKKAREIALQVLYQKDITKEPIETVWKVFCEHHQPPAIALDYAWYLVKGVNEYLSYIDVLIEKYTIRWSIERISLIERNILRLAVYEMFYIEDVPPKVSINEAIELAKKYGTKTSASFINGVLDAIFHKELIKRSEK